ncbi:MAG: two-component system, response regulator PdtaR [Solirubrobacteraceae bacterium]|jgi:response regulator NasT|nr:two-component system, response regulator PdtaR [Solirubrobacteraceae bacterium]
MNEGSPDRLRVLIADENREALQHLAEELRALGHQVAAFAITVGEASHKIAAEDPDAAMVKVHRDDEHALDLIGEIAEYASGPVIVLLDAEDPEFVAAAAEQGIYAYVRPVAAETLQGALEVALRRHADAEQLSEKVEQLETALERRAMIERAKGILMERHSVDDAAAFALLRDHARGNNRTVLDVARAVADGHALLPRVPARGEHRV